MQIAWIILPKQFNEAWHLHTSIPQQIMIYSGWFIGSIIGFWATRFLIDCIGRLKLQYISIFFFVISSIGHVVLGVLNYNPILFVILKILAGIGHGIIYIVLIIYAGETSTRSKRGQNVSYIYATIASGILLYISLDFSLFQELEPNFGIGLFSLVFCILSTILVKNKGLESPVYLIIQSENELAIQNFMKIRSIDIYSAVQSEFQEMQDMINEDLIQKERERWRCNKISVKTLTYIILSRLAHVFTFNSQLLLVLNEILAKMHVSNFWIRFIIFLVMVFRVLISFCIGTFVDKIGRKPILKKSIYGASNVLLFTGLIYLLLMLLVENVYAYWSIVLLVISVFLINGIGLSFIPDILTSEVFPTHMKAEFISIAVSFEYIISCLIVISMFQFDLLKFFPLWLFICGLLLTVLGFILKQMPETGMISLREVRNLFWRYSNNLYN